PVPVAGALRREETSSRPNQGAYREDTTMVLKVGQRVAYVANEAMSIGEISYGPFKVQAGSPTNWYLVRRPDGTETRFTQRDLVPVARFQVGEYFRTASGVRAKVS